MGIGKALQSQGYEFTASILTVKHLLRYGLTRKLVWVFVWNGSDWRDGENEQ